MTVFANARQDPVKGLCLGRECKEFKNPVWNSLQISYGLERLMLDGFCNHTDYARKYIVGM